MNDSNDGQFDVDLTNCDREPIHLLGRVQEFGFLIGCTSDWLIRHVSENVSDFLEADAQSLIGDSVSRLLDPSTIHTLRNRLQNLRPGGYPDIVTRLEVHSAKDGQLFDVSVHISGSEIVLEFEPARPQMRADRHVADVQQAINRISRLDSVDAILRFATRFSSSLMGFDRVMAYVFNPDDTGEVRAETHAPGMESFLGLRYPSTDIPRQARILYVQNPVRTIANINKDGSPILPLARSQEDALDLSSSVLRSVSPIHLEYLRNMGVGASVSLSIVVHGRLWGLIACHHRQPKVLDQTVRNSMVLFAQMLSLLIAERISTIDSKFQTAANELINRFSRSAATSGDIGDVILAQSETALDLMSADGMAVLSDGKISTEGRTPSDDDIEAIARQLNVQPPGQVYATNELSKLDPDAASYLGQAAGVLSIPISKSPRDYILFFRSELVKKVTWAGNPEKPVTLGPNGIRLTPRKSFEAWQDLVEGQSAEWTKAEIAAAEQFRVTVLEVVLRLADDAAMERKRAAEKQELLIAELNHRVRNILGLVRSLIAQTSKSETSVAEFAQVLESRVQSLARAHDQITEKNWTHASLRSLISTEAEAYLLDKSSRIRIDGPDALLTPVAYSNLALVIHEMMTNSAKYGALSDRSGMVEVDLTVRDDGALDIGWLEKNGPPVKPPERRGFGTTIIERAVPYELHGEASIDYATSGVTAKFVVPASFVTVSDEPEVAQTAAQIAAEERALPEIDFPKKILVVEDNLIIAMDTEAALMELGATKVTVCGDLHAGLTALEDSRPDFALLDINLGNGNSFPLAEKLMAESLPFVFASGYGDLKTDGGKFDGCLVVGKPYDKERLRQVILACLETKVGD
ncbi:HWE histidine kinase domain-containing protein [Tepidamorphus sp. 3E244]|uniref:HWE histidine kinase domain-containing protein n=1 Tax=Tepidamorphus sp. 3E244 TaxID=3385498 RepID=UPI0038FCD2E9